MFDAAARCEREGTEESARAAQKSAAAAADAADAAAACAADAAAAYAAATAAAYAADAASKKRDEVLILACRIWTEEANATEFKTTV
jgi:hypothetical protein